MKLTQAITNWFHKMFAWWPWKQSTQIEYTHNSRSLNTGTNQESKSKTMHESTLPQTGIAPRLSTIQEWPEHVVQTDVPAKNEFSETSALEDGTSMKKPATPTNETSASMQASPSPQQRLEFLRYLVKHGIVNEGVDDDR